MNAPIHVFPWTLSTPPTLIDLGTSTRSRSPDESAAWDHARRANPELHDSPILAVSRWDAKSGSIAVERSAYSLLVAGLPPPLALGVSGVFRRSTPCGPQVLAGQRANNTRIYGGLWETAPRGAVHVPSGELSPSTLSDALRREALEELGYSSTPNLHVIALVLDPVASSLDVVYGVNVDDQAASSQTAPASWEYKNLCWLDTTVLRAWAAQPGRLSPPTAALISSGCL